jgi:hypothetical protein
MNTGHLIEQISEGSRRHGRSVVPIEQSKAISGFLAGICLTGADDDRLEA